MWKGGGGVHAKINTEMISCKDVLCALSSVMEPDGTSLVVPKVHLQTYCLFVVFFFFRRWMVKVLFSSTGHSRSKTICSAESTVVHAIYTKSDFLLFPTDKWLLMMVGCFHDGPETMKKHIPAHVEHVLSILNVAFSSCFVCWAKKKKKCFDKWIYMRVHLRVQLMPSAHATVCSRVMECFLLLFFPFAFLPKQTTESCLTSNQHSALEKTNVRENLWSCYETKKRRTPSEGRRRSAKVDSRIPRQLSFICQPIFLS